MITVLSPIAAFGGMLATVGGKNGFAMLFILGKFMMTFYLTCVFFIFVILGLIMRFYKLNIFKLLSYVKEEILIVFGSSSSESVLPNIMSKLENAGCSSTVVGLVIPTGYSFNLDGTTLYLSLATVFVAQMSGVHLSIGEQISVCLVLMLTSKGVAGVRGASFVILAGTCASIGLDPEKVSVILAVDALMDMGRTSVNVLGNCLASAVIARSEKELDVSQKMVLN